MTERARREVKYGSPVRVRVRRMNLHTRQRGDTAQYMQIILWHYISPRPYINQLPEKNRRNQDESPSRLPLTAAKTG